MNLFKQTTLYTVLFFAVLFCMTPRVSHAALFSVVSDQDSFVVGNPFEVIFYIDTENETINTVSGSVVYPKDILKIESINTGNSSITFWVVDPSQNKNTPTLDFAGIVPGGINTQKGMLFSIVFTPLGEGNSEINLGNTDVFLHDGSGTLVFSKATPLTFVVGPSDENGVSPNNYTVNDSVSPEKFTLYRTQSPYIFDNQWFVTFASQDKISGIQKYTLCESLFKKCRQTTSPHVLSNQSSWYVVRVYAYDNALNTRMSILVSQNIKITLYALLLLGILYISYVYIQKKRKK